MADKLLRTVSIGLGLEGHELKDAVGGDELVYNLKINYYPPCPCPDLALGVPAHTDMSVITILVPNDVPGLQSFQDGHWYDVNYIPNALVVHIGDQIEVLTFFLVNLWVYLIHTWIYLIHTLLAKEFLDMIQILPHSLA